MLSIVVMISILMLTMSAFRLGVARLNTIRTADFQAFENATTGPTPLYTDDSAIPPVDGFGAVRPGLPNRVHSPRTTADVVLLSGSAGVTIPPAQVGGAAAVISPAWAYSAYPFPSVDRGTTQDWLEQYAADPRAGLSDPLGLAPVWPP